ncbi:MAG: hypothetical protein IPM24_07350 [Bryobacterales bacterium]|nr:hypothetical protein [Bryobacterales bacterium]
MILRPDAGRVSACGRRGHRDDAQARDGQPDGVRALKDTGIVAAPRQGWVRPSPHFYISPEEIDRTVAVLADA